MEHIYNVDQTTTKASITMSWCIIIRAQQYQQRNCLEIRQKTTVQQKHKIIKHNMTEELTL